MMSFAARALLSALALILLAGSAAGTADAAVSEADVFSALGINRISADYVIVVDTSGSMEQGGLYGQVQSALRPLLKGVSPRDHLSLLTFDTTPALRYSGAVGVPSDRALGQLPGKATGQHTDIGAAISAALDELERPGAANVGTVVLLTDGKHDPGPGSAYPSTSGSPWDTLGRRGSVLTQRAVISAYALALRPSTDASLLKRAFSGARVIAVPPDQIQSFLQRVKDEVRLAKAKSLIGPDRNRQVQVVWPAKQLSHLDLTKGSAKVNVRVRSMERHVPLTLEHLSIHAQGIQIKASDLPTAFDLAPGQERSLPVQLSFRKAGGFHFGHKTVRRHGALTLAADVTSPWAAILKRDLRTPLRVTVATTAAPITATGVIGWSLLALLVLALLAVLLLFVLSQLWIGRNPKLRGTVTASGADVAPPQKLLLSGRVVPIGKRRGSRLEIPGSGSIRGRRVRKKAQRGKDIELVISYAKTGKDPKMGRCPQNASAIVDGVTFTYRLG